MTERAPVVAIYGATALGKSDVSLAVAEHLGAEIVVADSMQVYAGLPIVTNQPDEARRRRVAHHLVGFVAPQDEFSVVQYAAAAHAVLDRLLGQGKPVVIEGGSGLYLRAALGDLGFGAPPDGDLRREFEELWARDPAAVLDELRAIDPDTVARLDAANPRRVLRAFEALRATSAPLPPAPRDALWEPAERYDHRLVALVPDKERRTLGERIAARVDEMLAAGALAEVAQARAAGPISPTALQAIGVRELCAHLDGELSLAEAAARMTSRTRALARRQLTWMRKLPAPALVPATGRAPARVAADVLALLR